MKKYLLVVFMLLGLTPGLLFAGDLPKGFIVEIESVSYNGSQLFRTVGYNSSQIEIKDGYYFTGERNRILTGVSANMRKVTLPYNPRDRIRALVLASREHDVCLTLTDIQPITSACFFGSSGQSQQLSVRYQSGEVVATIKASIKPVEWQPATAETIQNNPYLLIRVNSVNVINSREDDPMDVLIEYDFGTKVIAVADHNGLLHEDYKLIPSRQTLGINVIGRNLAPRESFNDDRSYAAYIQTFYLTSGDCTESLEDCEYRLPEYKRYEENVGSFTI